MKLTAGIQIFDTLYNVSWAISFIIVLIVLIILIQHFKKTSTCNVSLKIFPLLSTTTDALICLSAITINNNWLIQVIDDHCSLTAMLQGFMFMVSNYTLWLFQLQRIKYFFISTKFKLSFFSYYMQLVTYTIIALISLYYSVLYTQPTILIASDNIKHKICFLTAEQTPKPVGFLIVFFSNTFGISIYLWYQLYSKTNKLELEYNDNQQLSSFFSQKDKRIMNTTNIKRGIFWNTLLFITTVIAGIAATYSIIYGCIASSFMFLMKGIFTLSCFDIQWGLKSGDSTRIILENRKKQDEYLKQIMKAYYQVPQRSNRHINVTAPQIQMHVTQ